MIRKLFRQKVIALVLIGLITATLFQRCRKEENLKVQEKANLKMGYDKKLVNYLSTSINVNITDIKYDSSKEEFVVRDSYRILKSDLQREYEVANEYKLNFEKDAK